MGNNLSKKPPLEQTVPDLLKFHPEWYTDPPSWPWILVRDLSQEVRVELAKQYLQTQQEILAVQSKAITGQLGILSRVH